MGSGLPARSWTKNSQPNMTSPVTMEASATLNTGHGPTSMKSVTWPSKNRSSRFPAAPPNCSPMLNRSKGPGVRWLWNIISRTIIPTTDAKISAVF